MPHITIHDPSLLKVTIHDVVTGCELAHQIWDKYVAADKKGRKELRVQYNQVAASGE